MDEVMIKLDTRSARMLEEALKIMPYTREELVSSGVFTKVVERLSELKERDEELSGSYHSLERLEAKIKTEGITPDDHGLYDDLLEWQAVRKELKELKGFLVRI